MRIVLVLSLLLLLGCAGTPPAPSGSPAAPSGSPAATHEPSGADLGLSVPAGLMPSGEPHPRKVQRARLTPLGTLTTRYWVGNPLVFRLALLQLLTDPANPLELTPEEQAQLQPLFATLVEKQREIWARCAVVRENVGEWWLTHEQVDDMHEHRNFVDVPEATFASIAPEALAALQAAAKGETVAPTPYSTPWTPPQGHWPEFRERDIQLPGEDDTTERTGDIAQPPEDLAFMLAVVAPKLTPPQAARCAAELEAIAPNVSAQTTAWTALTHMGTEKGRGEKVAARARELKAKEKHFQVYRVAWDYLEARGALK